MPPVRGRGSPLCSKIVIYWVFPETSRGLQRRSNFGNGIRNHHPTPVELLQRPAR
jgi:hypothetical protein